MKLKTGLRLAMAAVLLLGAGLSATDRTSVDLSTLPVGLMKFTGQVSIETRGEQSLWVSIEVSKGGVPVSAGEMTVGGRRAPFATWQFHLDLKGSAIHSGDMVPVSFKPPWPGLPTYSATLAAPQLIQFSAPLNEAHVASAAAGSLEIRWTGGTPPFRFAIRKSSVAGAIVSLRDLPAGSVSIPFSSLTPGQRYTIEVTDALRFYAFTPEVDPHTSLYLRQIIWSHFYLD
jgi:hypothetical protein